MAGFVLQWVSFICGDRPLSEREKQRLLLILEGESEKDAESIESIEIMEAFIDEYMGGEVATDGDEDCSFGEDCFCFNFWCEEPEDHPYDREDMELVRAALNMLLGRKAFTRYKVGGIMKSDL